MIDYIKIPDTSLSRDMRSKGLVETDKRKIDEYQLKSSMLKSAKTAQDEIRVLKEKIGEIEFLKDDIREIKELLKRLVK